MRARNGGEVKRLCIVGGGSTRLRAPYDDKEALIWSTFSVGQELPRVDACFEIHNGVYSPEQLDKAGCDIYMKEAHPEVAKSIRFPIERIEKIFGKRFNGTVAMILGYAFLMGHRDIWLYGIDISTNAEYARRNMFYWLMGFLTGQGCKITIPEGGLLRDTCKTYVYEDDEKGYLEYIRNRVRAQTGDDLEQMIVRRERIQYQRGVEETLEQIERRY
jgi:hypothetical protein